MLSFGQLTCKGEVVCPIVLMLSLPIRLSILFSAVIIADEDYQFYLEWLKEYADKADCSIHSYVLMTNHVYLLVSAEKADAIGAFTNTRGHKHHEKRYFLTWVRGFVWPQNQLISGK